MQIPIDIQVLKSVLRIDDETARKLIDSTKRVRINENTLIEVESEHQRITVKAPDDLGYGLLVIDLVNEHGRTTTLAYDQKTKKFRQRRNLEELTDGVVKEDSSTPSHQEKKVTK